MPKKPLAQKKVACLSQLPQLDAAIPARASQEAFVGRKGQSPHPAAMPDEALDAGCRVAPLLLPDLPQPQRARAGAGCEQAPIRITCPPDRVPGQRGDRVRMR